MVFDLTLFYNSIMRKYHVLLTISLLLVFNQNIVGQLFNEETYKFSKVLGLIETFYVDSVDKAEMVDNAIVRMLKELDPHSVYISKEDVQKMNEPLQGSFEGIGIQFNIMNDTLLVVSPISGGPSEKVGILAGDRIVKIDDELVAGIGLTNKIVFDRLRGDKGTKVIVSIKRGDDSELLDFEIIRDKIPIYSLDAAYMVNDNSAYIKLNRFAATTMNEYSKAINELRDKGAENIILDLTNNGGGYLNMAFELANEFLQQGQMVVYTEGLNNPRQDYKASKFNNDNYRKVVIMIDEGSASASEIVTGAIQDWDRGVVVGRRSFGKGLVQRPFNLPDKSMIRLTIANYYTPTGRLIQKPYDNGVEAYHKEMITRYNNGELSNEDSIHFPDSLKFYTLNNKRTVYGGGGIMPDIFVPIDTTGYSNYYRDLIRKGIINHFVIQYLDNNRKKLEHKFSNDDEVLDDAGFIEFKSSFDITEGIINNLVKFAESKNLPFDAEGLKKSKIQLKTNLKALIARDLWGTSMYFEIINQLDPIFLEAVKVLEDDDAYGSKLDPKN